MMVTDLPSAVRTPNPLIIQGGMGVAVSSWPLARAVALEGELGVVSGTAAPRSMWSTPVGCKTATPGGMCAGR